MKIDKPKINFAGAYFDLMAIFNELNYRFFENKISAKIKWGLNKTKANYQKKSIRLGSYNPNNLIITIHPALDRAIVPRIVLERIIFHEMAHQKYPVVLKNNKNIIHSKEFNNFENLYPYLSQADYWLKVNLVKLL